MDVFDLFARISLDSSEYESGLKNASASTSKFGESIKAGIGTAVKVGAAAIGAATTAVVAFGTSSVQTGAQFDSSMAQVAATMGTTVDSIQELRDFALEMGSATAFSASQAADALNYMALAGYDAETSMSMLPNVLNLAAAGGMELATASDMITDSQSALGLSLEETTDLVDKMAKASSQSNTSVSQLGEAILTVGGTAKMLSGGTTELSTALGILADNGTKGAEGGTKLRNILLSLGAPTDTAAKALDSLGVSAYDAEGNMRPLQDVFGDLNDAMADMSSAEKTDLINTIFNKTDIKDVNALLATSADRWEELSAAIDDSTGAAQNMADTQLDNLAGDITLFKSALEGAQIAISDKLTPYLREFVTFGTEGIGVLTSAFQDGGLNAAMSTFGEIISDGLGRILELLPEAMGAGGQLLGALADGIIDNLPILLDSAVEIVTNLLEGLAENADGIVDGAINLVQMLGEGIINAAPALGAAALDVITAFGEALIDSSGAIMDAFGISEVADIADSILDNIPELISTANELVNNFLDYITDNAPALLDSGVEIISNVVNGILENLPDLLTGAGEIVDSLLNYINDYAPMLLASGVELISNIVSGIVNNLPAIVSVAVQVVSQLLTTIASNAPALLQSGIELIGQLATGLINDIPEIVAAITQGIVELLATIGEHLPDLLESGIELIGQLAAGLIQAIPDILAAIPQIITSVVNAFSQHDWGSIGSNIISGIASGIRNGVSTIISAAKEAASSALNAAKDFLGIKSPSRVFRDQVGKMLTLGMAQGMVSNDVLRALDDAAEELTGETVKDLETMVKAWNDVYDSYYEGLKHQNFFLEMSGDTDQIIANYRTIQQTLHEQKEHYLSLGVDSNNRAIRQMEEDWWKYQKNIVSTISDAYDAVISGMEHSLFLAEKNGKSATERIEILRKLQATVHEEAEEYRRLGLAETSEEIMSRQRLYWQYEDEIKKINEEEISGFEKVAKAMQDAYDEAFNNIVKKRDALENKLAGYANLFNSATSKATGKTYVELDNIDRQTATLEKWGSVLESLRERGIGESLMQQILSLGIDEGLAYGQKLLSLTDTKWDSYMASYERNRQVAADIANRYYQPEFDALNGQNFVEISAADQKQLEYSEEEVGLLRRIAESFQDTGQVISVKVGDRELVEVLFDQIVLVGKSRGYDILGGNRG